MLYIANTKYSKYAFISSCTISILQMAFSKWLWQQIKSNLYPTRSTFFYITLFLSLSLSWLSIALVHIYSLTNITAKCILDY